MVKHELHVHTEEKQERIQRHTKTPVNKKPKFFLLKRK